MSLWTLLVGHLVLRCLERRTLKAYISFFSIQELHPSGDPAFTVYVGQVLRRLRMLEVSGCERGRSSLQICVASCLSGV